MGEVRATFHPANLLQPFATIGTLALSTQPIRLPANLTLDG